MSHGRCARACLLVGVISLVGCGGRGSNSNGTAATDASSATTTAIAPLDSSPLATGGAYQSAITADVLDNPAFDDFEKQITGLINKTSLPGASLLVVQHGELIEQEAWLDYTLDTVVPIASGSKWLTAATIMTLVDDGLLALDEPISTYVPDAAGAPAGKITMRQLLSFTSGLVSDDDVPCVSDPASTLVDCATTLAALPLVHSPGEVFRYGGEHLYVAAAIAEVVTGVPYAELFRQRIADPLGMTKTFFVQVDGSRYTDVTNTKPASGAVTTLGDYGRFLEMITHDGVAPDGTRLLQSATIAEMQTNQISEARYGNAAPFRVKDKAPYGLGEWLDWTNPDGSALVLSSDGALGFRPWIDKQNDLFGVYLVKDDGSAAVDGNPTPDADDANQVYVSGNWIYELVADALNNPLPKEKYPDR